MCGVCACCREGPLILSSEARWGRSTLFLARDVDRKDACKVQKQEQVNHMPLRNHADVLPRGTMPAAEGSGIINKTTYFVKKKVSTRLQTTKQARGTAALCSNLFLEQRSCFLYELY